MTEFVERLRAFEHRCQEHLKEIRCPVHVCLGQEHVPAELHRLLKPEDWVFSTHRSHGHALAKGVDEDRLWDEIMGRESGLNGGFRGSQCFSDPTNNFHASAIVGGLVGVATGVALALSLTRHTGVVACCLGDGATEQGVFWESLNFAAVKELPIAFICENNEYSVHTHISERQSTPIWARAAAFGVSVQVTVEDALQAARDEQPSFVEIKCVRECPHVRDMEDFRPHA